MIVGATTAPAWSPLFASIAALVTDTGGILCHAAVVAREYGLPAVVGTDDPIKGQALIPFAQEDQLAWYIFDLFDGNSLHFWRYHKDPLETRRPLAVTPGGAADNVTVV